MLKVGITGGIGAGKSIVSRMFAVLGVPVYDADSRAKWLMHRNEALKQELVMAFGPETFAESGELNRGYLAGLVFNNTLRLEQLNSLVHPHVGNDFEEWAALHAEKPYVLKEAALMFESESWRQMDEIIAVYSPLELRIKRLLQRDTHRTEADILAIIGRQLSEEEKMRRAQHVIYNDDRQLLIPQVLALHDQFSRAIP